jgi:hypothetical protein
VVPGEYGGDFQGAEVEQLRARAYEKARFGIELSTSSSGNAKVAAGTASNSATSSFCACVSLSR